MAAGMLHVVISAAPNVEPAPDAPSGPGHVPCSWLLSKRRAYWPALMPVRPNSSFIGPNRAFTGRPLGRRFSTSTTREMPAHTTDRRLYALIRHHKRWIRRGDVGVVRECPGHPKTVDIPVDARPVRQLPVVPGANVDDSRSCSSQYG